MANLPTFEQIISNASWKRSAAGRAVTPDRQTYLFHRGKLFDLRYDALIEGVEALVENSIQSRWPAASRMCRSNSMPTNTVISAWSVACAKWLDRNSFLRK